MGLGNCKECGKLCMQTPTGLCPDCVRAEEENEDTVAKYLRNHDRASLSEIHDATGVPEKTILRMIKKGRIAGITELSYPCETCGKPITEGRVCTDCGRRVLGQIKSDARPASAPAPATRPTGGGLHTTFNKR